MFVVCVCVSVCVCVCAIFNRHCSRGYSSLAKNMLRAGRAAWQAMPRVEAIYSFPPQLSGSKPWHALCTSSCA